MKSTSLKKSTSQHLKQVKNLKATATKVQSKMKHLDLQLEKGRQMLSDLQ